MQEESARRWVLAFAQLSLPPRISLSVSTLCRVAALRVLFSFHSSGPFIFRPRCKSSRSFSSVALSCQPHRMAVTAERVSAARLPSCGTHVCQLSFFSQKRAFHKKPCTCPAQTHLLLRASLMLTMVLSFKRNSAFWRKIGNE